MLLFRLSLMLMPCALVACTGDGDLLYVRLAATQPDAPEFGRLVDVFAQAGDRSEQTRLALQVSGGELHDPRDFSALGPVCAAVPAGKLALQEVAVIPANDEALLVAVLHDVAGDDPTDCSGAIRTQIIVPIQRVGADPPVDAAVIDAPLPSDAAVDAPLIDAEVDAP